MSNWNPPAEGTKERNEMPKDCFLDEKNRKYPYKEMVNDKWVQSEEGLHAALQRAEQFDKTNIADKAKKLLNKYFPKTEAKTVSRLRRIANR